MGCIWFVLYSFLFYMLIFLGDGSICSTTSNTENGDVDAFLLQVRHFFYLLINNNYITLYNSLYFF